MLSLPPILGRFPVGVTTFVVPVRPTRSVGQAMLKNSKISQPAQALQLEEVAFTVYYPADTSNKPSEGIDWLFRPLSDSLLGLSIYMGVSTWLLWPVVYLFGSLLKIPAYLNAPLLHPEKVQDFLEKQWPLVIFSHGLGGSRTTYSQYCSRLAASGKVVLALEHRDGSGLACTPRSWHANGKEAHRSIVYLRETDIYWEDGMEPKNHPKPWRGEQLMFRHLEINTMYEAFLKFITKDVGSELESIDGSWFDKASWSNLTSVGKTIIRYNEDVFLIGHSFGGATSLSLLAAKPSDYARIPISKVIVLDPWLDPLPSSGPVPFVVNQSHNGPAPAKTSGQPPSNGATNIANSGPSLPLPSEEPPRVLVINSEAFTLWEDHFARLQEIMAIWEPQGRRIATLIGSEHISFSDFSVLPIIRKKSDAPIFDNIIRLSLAFLENRLDDALESEVPTTNMNIRIIGTKPNGKPKKKLDGNVGHVIIS